jgi:apolipoprotein N-acyltransferase
MADASAFVQWQERLTAPIAEFAAQLRAMRPWQRLLVVGFDGALAAFAQGPFYLWPLLFLALPIFVWLIDAANPERRPWLAAALVGWSFGFGYFFVGLHWIAYAFLVDVKAHLWLLPFAAVSMPAGLALFLAVPIGLLRLVWPNDWARVACFAAGLSLFEWLRGHILTGFPWNLFGYVWSGSDWMIQSASLFGVYALSLITIIAAAAPAALLRADGTRAPWQGPVAVAVALPLLLLAFGAARLPSAAALDVPGVALRIVQPDVPQAERWKDEYFLRNWRRLIDLTRMPGLETRTHVIWPEAAPPLLMLTEPEALKVVGDVLPDRTLLLTGVVRREAASPRDRFYNSMAVIDGQGRVLSTYDKAHLVPFGEYMPLQNWFDALGITKITGGSGGYSTGPGVRTLTLPSGPSVGPLICYEIIFPDEVVQSDSRPQWLVNLTDDSWFGPWVGPYQHLGIARVRAAEEGLPVVRSANTGVSAIIDPFGRVVSSLDLNKQGVLDGSLPQALPMTLYARAGDVLFFVFLLLTAIVGRNWRALKR